MRKKDTLAAIMQMKNYNATIGDRIISDMSLEETLESARQIGRAHV